MGMCRWEGHQQGFSGQGEGQGENAAAIVEQSLGSQSGKKQVQSHKNIKKVSPEPMSCLFTIKGTF